MIVFLHMYFLLLFPSNGSFLFLTVEDVTIPFPAYGGFEELYFFLHMEVGCRISFHTIDAIPLSITWRLDESLLLLQ